MKKESANQPHQQRGMIRMICLGAAMILVCCAIGQDTSWPYYKEVRAFRSMDSVHHPAPDMVLFVGSSSFTLWKDVQSYFPGVPILNRAFGGSTLLDVWRYREQLFGSYAPRRIIMYCGENDMAFNDTVSVAEVLRRFKQLFVYIRQVYPRTPFVYVSMKPSPSRRKLWPMFMEANVAIRQYLAQHKRTSFVDVYHAMLDAAGRPFPHIFIKDSLHMNAAGYQIWQKKLKPYIK